VNINATLIGQALWFLFFIWLVMKFIWPYFQRKVAERQKIVADGLAAADKGQKDLAQAESRANDAVREARAKAVQIVDQAQHRANELIDQAKVTAVAEGERLLAAAQQQIQLESNRARENLRKEIAGLALAGASQLLERAIDPQAHKELLERLAAQVGHG
jgi:F-type H+-transporting ATPase subunit b